MLLVNTGRPHAAYLNLNMNIDLVMNTFFSIQEYAKEGLPVAVWGYPFDQYVPHGINLFCFLLNKNKKNWPNGHFER